MIDDIDRRILFLLQKDGRMTVTALASAVGLTVAPCHRRLKDLEADGVITGYRALVDAPRIGLGFQALVFVTLKDRQNMRAFEDEVEAIPEITEASRLFGEPDFLLKVMAADLPGYQKFYDEVLIGLAGVEKLTSTIVMKSLKGAGELPL
ncbi:Lrp/AsnC family transcriptional regulator [Arthrobacter sp.]|uniref:Lrp/AsnC family transcriptional regulator n=1 Tax=Arthrobacter sp. TaxID=1667 RepID=UPI003A8F0D6C